MAPCALLRLLALLTSWQRGVQSIRIVPKAIPPGVQTVVAPVTDLAPIWWLHIPKAGSSLATTLAHHVCGSAIEADMTVAEPHENSLRFAKAKGFGRCSVLWDAEGCATNRWNAQCGQGSFLHFDSGHAAMPADFPEDQLHHVVAMFRDPVQRAISGWFHGKHGCQWAQDLNSYAVCIQDCSMQMLAGIACGGNRRPPPDDVDGFMGRVRKLGFVGLTSEWELSICLFHAMHGGVCKEEEFSNVRPGAQRNATSGMYDPAGYGWAAPETGLDGRVYAIAKEVFWENVRRYNVNRRTCMQEYCAAGSRFFEVMGEIPSTFRDQPEGSRSMYDFDWPGRASFDED